MWLRLITAAAGLLLLQGVTYGQEPNQQVPANPLAPSASVVAEPASDGGTLTIREEKPAVYLLPDGKGGYQKVINFPLEQFKKLLELERQLESGSGKPAYSVEMTGRAAVEGGRAQLELEFVFTVLAEGWIRVPLRLDEAVILSQQRQGGGELVLVPADDAPGYVAWLKGDAGEPTRLTITAVMPVSRVGGEARLRLSLPRLTTSELKLQVPLRDATVQTPQGAIVERLTAASSDVTLVRAVGASGSVDLSWRESPRETGPAPAVLSASGAIQVQIDGQAATTTATLTISAAAGGVERFHVLLPAGATLISGEANGYSVTAQVDPAAVATESPGRTRVEIHPLDKPEKQVELRLITEQLLPAGGGIGFVDLAGFEVVGARHQTGFLALRVVGDWQLVFGDRRNVREVSLGDLPSNLRSNELVSAFEYLAQPGALMARVVPRRPRVAVEPQYVYRVTADAIELDARLRYTVRGARVFALDVEFPDDGWEIEEIGPAGLVDLDGVLFEQLQPLSVPLLQPGSGEFELRCRARRRLNPSQSQIEFGLPRPLANSVGPAKVIVLAADNVELVLRGDEMAGLGRQSTAAGIELPPQQQEPLVYRGDVDRAVFAADRRVLKQVVTAQVATRVELGEAIGTVDQTIKYSVRYEPLERIGLRVPRELLGARAVEVLLDGQRVSWLSDRDADGAAADAQLIFVPLAKPLIGSAEIRVRFSLPEQKLAPRVSVPLSIPLVSPADAADAHHEVTILARSGLEVRGRGEQWRQLEQPLGESLPATPLRLATDLPTTELTLALSLEDPEAFGATVVDRAWIQTWLGEQRRQDRLVLRVSSRQPSLRLTLPAGAAPATVEVLLDDNRVTARAGEDGQYAIPLDPRAASDQHTVEIAYDIPRSWGLQVAMQPPRFADDVRVGNTYWQLVLPKHQHVATGPRNFGSEFTWGWQGYYWGRQPQLEQFELETWASAGHRTPLPSTTNRYLYSAMGRPEILALWVVPRWLIVLVASGAALVAGLGLVYVPKLRQPALLGIAAIAVLAAGAVYPEPTLMILQAASLGAVLTLLAGLLKGSLTTRTATSRAGSTLLRSGSSIARRGDADPPYRSSAGAGSNSSTETGPLAGQLAGPDSKS